MPSNSEITKIEDLDHLGNLFSLNLVYNNLKEIKEEDMKHLQSLPEIYER